eukprot:5627502-Amphidinium_carterae.1
MAFPLWKHPLIYRRPKFVVLIGLFYGFSPLIFLCSMSVMTSKMPKVASIRFVSSNLMIKALNYRRHCTKELAGTTRNIRYFLQ